MGDARDDAAAAEQTAARRRVPRWVIGAVVLPVAVLASVATSRGEDPTFFIVESGDGWVVTTDECADWPCTYDDYYARTAVGWEEVAAPVGPDSSEEPWAPPTQWSDCLEANSSVCYRAVDGTASVERSADGGKTWEFEWGLTDQDVEFLKDEYEADGPAARAEGIGVFDGVAGEEVWASMGPDGLAVRHPDGTWERVGWGGIRDIEDAPREVPSEALARPGAEAARAAFQGLAWAAGFASVASILAATVLATRRSREWWTYVFAGLAAAAVGIGAFVPGIMVDADKSVGWPEFGATAAFAVVFWALSTLAMGGLGVIPNIWQRDTAGAVGLVALASLGFGWLLGGVGAYLGLHASVGAGTGAFVGAAAMVVVVKMRRHA